GIDRNRVLGKQPRISGALLLHGFAPHGASRHIHPEPRLRQPDQPFERRHKCAWTALLLVAFGSEMVERYANCQFVTKAIPDVEKRVLDSLHRPHRIGKHQNAESARETILDHAEEVRIHERLAAGEPDLFRAPAVALDLVEITGDFVAREI